MAISWKAVAYGFIGTIVLGLISGASVPFAHVSLPFVGWGVTGLVGGLIAGYVASGSVGRGAFHGGLATIIGALVVLLVLSAVGTLFGGILGIGLLLTGLVLLVVHAIPGAIGGGIGTLLKTRQSRKTPASSASTR